MSVSLSNMGVELQLSSLWLLLKATPLLEEDGESVVNNSSPDCETLRKCGEHFKKKPLEKTPRKNP
jgi:hypothetical protein